MRRVLLAALLPTAVGVLPSFLAGTVAVQLRADLDFGAGDLGLLFGAFFGAGAIGSAMLGRWAQHIGSHRALRVAALAAGADLMAIALLARSFATLLVLLALGGVANALAQPAANLWLSDNVPPAQQGLAFGVKQAAIPAAMLIGGLAVPAVAVPIGWRWAFAIAAIGAPIAALTVPARPVADVGAVHGQHPRPTRARQPIEAPAPLHLRPLLVLACGIAFGAAAAGTIGAFIVSAAVDAGMGESAAGLLFAFGAAVGLSARLLLGRRADRVTGGQLATVVALMAGGSAGYLLLASESVPVIALATPFIFAVGWGWPGLFNLSIVRHHPGSAAAATGITQTGTYVGAVGGPVLFGLAVDAWGYGPSWLLAAAAALAAAATTWTGRHLLRASIATRAAQPLMRLSPSQ